MNPKGTIEIYEDVKRLHERAYRRPNDNKKAYDKKVGHMLQALFGKEVWTLKDLRDEQLYIVRDLSQDKYQRKIHHEDRIATKPI